MKYVIFLTCFCVEVVLCCVVLCCVVLCCVVLCCVVLCCVVLCCVVQAQTLRRTDLSYCTTVPTSDSKHVIETQRQGLSPHRPVVDVQYTVLNQVDSGEWEWLLQQTDYVTGWTTEELDFDSRKTTSFVAASKRPDRVCVSPLPCTVARPAVCPNKFLYSR